MKNNQIIVLSVLVFAAAFILGSLSFTGEAIKSPRGGPGGGVRGGGNLDKTTTTVLSCSDTDGGLNIGEPGTVTNLFTNNNSIGTIKDYCLPTTPIVGSFISEIYCENGNRIAAKVDCLATGEICKDKEMGQPIGGFACRQPDSYDCYDSSTIEPLGGYVNTYNDDGTVKQQTKDYCVSVNVARQYSCNILADGTIQIIPKDIDCVRSYDKYCDGNSGGCIIPRSIWG